MGLVVLLDSGEFSDGSVLGCDFVGTVEKIGNDVSLLKEGDIIGGMVYGGNICLLYDKEKHGTKGIFRRD